MRIIMNEMATRKRVNITLHQEDIDKLDEICKQRNYKRSGMISKLIQEYSHLPPPKEYNKK